jgi:UDP-N-acetylglucosamine 2-epimerase (non-hydrolysing)
VKVLLVAGARPNFMKIAPIQAELDARGIDNVLVHTGQHYDASMSDVFFEELGIRPPEHHLEVGSGSHAVQTALVMQSIEPVLDEERPSWVVVVGDVNSTLAATLVAAKLGIAIAHVEAGLRSGDWTMPEEINRVVTDRLSDLLLAPSPDAIDNLRAEGVAPERIVVVGNVMADTLLQSLDRARRRPVLHELGLTAGSYGLVTLHRPSNVDDPDMLRDLLGTLDELAAEVPLVWPVHPRVRPSLRALDYAGPVRLIEPVTYLDSVALQSGARVVLTDSGGIQEETTVLGVPCLTLRTTTERPITIDEGTNQLVGVDREEILRGADRALRGEIAKRAPALWDGKAAQRTVDALVAGPAPR